MSELALKMTHVFPDALANEFANKSKPLQAFWLALAIEVFIVAVVALLLASSLVKHEADNPAVALTLVDEPAAPEKVPEPTPTPKPVVQPVKMLTKISPPKPDVPHPPVNQPTAPVAELQSDIPTAFSDPAPAVTPPPAPVPVHGKVDPNAEYAGKVHAAVQAAYFYPPAAAAMRFSGRVRVEFQLKDGHVTAAHVLQTCGIGLFDKAALQAVQVAQYPEPPAALRGQELPYQIWVDLTTH